MVGFGLLMGFLDNEKHIADFYLKDCCVFPLHIYNKNTLIFHLEPISTQI